MMFNNSGMRHVHANGQAYEQQLLICHAKDHKGEKEPLTLKEKIHFAQHQKDNSKQKNSLPHQVKLAEGLKVLILNNIAADLDITNGARGEIVDIILHREGPPLSNKPIIHDMP